MSFLSVVIVAILFFCIPDASASVISKEKKITTDDKNDLEYFHVPAHNGLSEADYLYDFKNNISVSRVKSKASCYLEPLPDNSPKPADLRTALQGESEAPSKLRKDLAVSEEVDKTLLRQEVQDFCSQFPVFRLQEVDSSPGTNVFRKDVGRTRFVRKIDLFDPPFCDKNPLPQKNCHPDRWLYSFKCRDGRHTWWVKNCRFTLNARPLTSCNHRNCNFKNIVCYKIHCP